MADILNVQPLYREPTFHSIVCTLENQCQTEHMFQIKLNRERAVPDHIPQTINKSTTKKNSERPIGIP